MLVESPLCVQEKGHPSSSDGERKREKAMSPWPLHTTLLIDWLPAPWLKPLPRTSGFTQPCSIPPTHRSLSSLWTGLLSTLCLPSCLMTNSVQEQLQTQSLPIQREADWRRAAAGRTLNMCFYVNFTWSNATVFRQFHCKSFFQGLSLIPIKGHLNVTVVVRLAHYVAAAVMCVWMRSNCKSSLGTTKVEKCHISAAQLPFTLCHAVSAQKWFSCWLWRNWALTSSPSSYSNQPINTLDDAWPKQLQLYVSILLQPRKRPSVT